MTVVQTFFNKAESDAISLVILNCSMKIYWVKFNHKLATIWITGQTQWQ